MESTNVTKKNNSNKMYEVPILVVTSACTVHTLTNNDAGADPAVQMMLACKTNLAYLNGSVTNGQCNSY